MRFNDLVFCVNLNEMPRPAIYIHNTSCEQNFHPPMDIRQARIEDLPGVFSDTRLH